MADIKCTTSVGMLQTLVHATVLVIGLSQLMAPAISFLNDMRPHCRGPGQNAAIPAFIGVITIVGIVWVLYPTGFGGDLLLQRNLPFRHRVELLCYIAVCAVILTVLVQILRRCIVLYQANHIRKLSAADYVPMSTETSQPPIARKSIDGHDAVLRSTASTDVGDWLRRTASVVTDLTALLPGQRRSNKVGHDQEMLPL